MINPIQTKNTIRFLSGAVNYLLPRRRLIVGALALAGALGALIPGARAVDPPPDGGYSGQNTAEGENALFSLTSGFDNTAVGFKALYSLTSGFSNTGLGLETLYFTTTGNDNTALGRSALFYNTTGSSNTAAGYSALYFNTTGGNNTGAGENALSHNTTGSYNTASGGGALANNTTANNNTATGYWALVSNTTGTDNTAQGANALLGNDVGSRNVAVGSSALLNNQTGIDNTATGVNALYFNIGNYNTAHGYQALESNTTGTNNTANGLNALNKNTTGFNNVASGASALYKNTIGSYNIALGYNAGYSLTSGSNNIEIGNSGLPAESNTIRIGAARTHTNTYIAGISGITVAGGVGVIVDTNGHLGTIASSKRFKEAIEPMDKASESILALKPVTFRYKQELDPQRIAQFGLLAEEVEKVNPDLVARDDEGKPYTVRYEAVNAMLLNEFLKEHRRVDALQGTLAQQQSINTELREEVRELKGALREQAKQVRKVSDELTVNRSASQILAGNE